MKSSFSVALLGLALGVGSQEIQFRTDSVLYGPALETVHAYYNQWPTGVAVSSTGRKFSCFPGGLDPANTNNGTPGVYTVGELTGLTSETAYPNLEINTPPGGAINYTTTPPTGANYPNYLIGVQSVVIDSADRLWLLDTGRVLTPDGATLVPSAYGGPKLIGIDLTTNTIFQTILFPQTVAYPDSYLNDVRFDLRPNVTASGKGVAYITDSSTEGRNGIVVADLGTGESWRHLSLAQSVRSEAQFVSWVAAEPVYYATSPGAFWTYLPFGSDGIAIAADGESLYWGPLSSRYLYSAPTEILRINNTEEVGDALAVGHVTSHGQKGPSDGFETDSNGFIYVGNFEQNAVALFNPANGSVITFVRDPRLNWVDTMSIATDGYLYFTVNQLNSLSAFFPGTDRRERPFALFKVPLPNNGTKISLI